MKAAFYKGNRSISVEEAPAIKPAPDEVKIDVAYCGICGTDRHIFHGVMDKRVSLPLIPGHEMSGRVSEVGSEVGNVSVGDLVVVRPLDNRLEEPSDRGYSHICKKLKFMGIDSPGGMQRSWVVPGFTVHKLPPGTDLKIAALTEPLAVACHDVERCGLREGETAVVIGGGPIGALVAMVAKQRGARVVLLEVNEARLAMAEELGLIPVNPAKEDAVEKVIRLTEGVGADVVFEVSGVDAGVKAMTELAAIRGRIVMVAIHGQPKPTNLFHFFWKELTMYGARVYEPQDYETAIGLIAEKALPLESLITDVAPLDKAQKAFEDLDGNAAGMKTLIDCQA